MIGLFVVFLAFVLAAGSVSAHDPGAEHDDVADAPFAVGRIEIIDGSHGYAIVQFPNGRRLIHIEKRDLWRYRVGDELRVDAFGRPQPPV